MEKYKYLQHTADAKFQAFGKTLEQAFSHAALATVSLMWDCEKIESRVEQTIEVSGRDEKQLLLNFLEEVLFLIDSRLFLLKRVKNIKISKQKGQFWLEARLAGDNHSEKYRTFGEVKAITYNEMEIVQKDSVKVQVVVDM